MLANVAELGAHMEETIGKASLRNAAIGTGVVVDNTMLALTGYLPSVQIASLVMPTAEER